jgi:selenocysteine lyase/cysteine desulfurase
VNYTRRQFLESASAAGFIAPLGVSAENTVSVGEERAASDGPASRIQSADDPLGVRGDFPAVEEGIYLNSPYITPSPRQVIDAGHAFWEAKARNPILLGDMLAEATRVRQSFARLVGATEAEVGILDATSAGENLVARSLDLGSGDNVVIDDLHYETTYALYRGLAETRGVELRIVRSNDGAATPEEFAELVDDATRLVSVAWVSHQNGYAHDLPRLADLAHAHSAYLYADAIQGIGMLPLDVGETGIDFLTTGTYKWLLGGYGVAPFFVRADLLDTIEPDRAGSLNIARQLPDFHFELHDDARKYLYATPAFGAVYQLGAALDYLLEVGVANIERHTVALARRLYDGLTSQGHRLLTPPGNGSAIVVFEHDHDPGAVRRSLEEAAIKVSLRAGGVQIRVGVALFNNAREIDEFLETADGWAGLERRAT